MVLIGFQLGLEDCPISFRRHLLYFCFVFVFGVIYFSPSHLIAVELSLSPILFVFEVYFTNFHKKNVLLVQTEMTFAIFLSIFQAIA